MRHTHLDLAGVQQVLLGVGHQGAGTVQRDGDHRDLGLEVGGGGVRAVWVRFAWRWRPLLRSRSSPAPAAVAAALYRRPPHRGTAPTLALAATEKAPFLKPCMRPSLDRVPSGKNSTDAFWWGVGGGVGVGAGCGRGRAGRRVWWCGRHEWGRRASRANLGQRPPLICLPVRQRSARTRAPAHAALPSPAPPTCLSSSPHCFRHSSWLRRSTRLIITWPGGV